MSERITNVSYLRTFLFQTQRKRSKFLWKGLRLVRKLSSKLRRVSSKSKKVPNMSGRVTKKSWML